MRLASPAVLSVPVSHEPIPWVKATVSEMWNPGIKRGGATGTSQKTAKAITLVSTSELRNGG